MKGIVTSREICKNNKKNRKGITQVKLKTNGEGVMQSGKKTKPQRSKKQKPWQLYLMSAIPILLVFIFNYLPMAGVVIAFKDYRYDKGIFGSDWVGLRFFRLFFAGKNFQRVVGNTLLMNAIFIVTGTIACIALALLLYYVKSKNVVKFSQTLLITPNFVSWVIAAYVVYTVLSPTSGFLNQFLGALGLETPDWYTIPEAWRVFLPIINIWKGFGMGCILYYATFIGVDPALLEAAELDGASTWVKIRHILLPSIKTILIITTILNIGSIFSADFGLFYNVPRNVSLLYPTTDVLSTYIYRVMHSEANYSLSAAAGLCQSVVGMILVVITNAVVRKIEPENSLY